MNEISLGGIKKGLLYDGVIKIVSNTSTQDYFVQFFYPDNVKIISDQLQRLEGKNFIDYVKEAEKPIYKKMNSMISKKINVTKNGTIKDFVMKIHEGITEQQKEKIEKNKNKKIKTKKKRVDVTNVPEKDEEIKVRMYYRRQGEHVIPLSMKITQILSPKITLDNITIQINKYKYKLEHNNIHKKIGTEEYKKKKLNLAIIHYRRSLLSYDIQTTRSNLILMYQLIKDDVKAIRQALVYEYKRNNKVYENEDSDMYKKVQFRKGKSYFTLGNQYFVWGTKGKNETKQKENVIIDYKGKDSDIVNGMEVNYDVEPDQKEEIKISLALLRKSIGSYLRCGEESKFSKAGKLAIPYLNVDRAINSFLLMKEKPPICSICHQITTLISQRSIIPKKVFVEFASLCNEKSTKIYNFNEFNPTGYFKHKHCHACDHCYEKIEECENIFFDEIFKKFVESPKDAISLAIESQNGDHGWLYNFCCLLAFKCLITSNIQTAFTLKRKDIPNFLFMTRRVLGLENHREDKLHSTLKKKPIFYFFVQPGGKLPYKVDFFNITDFPKKDKEHFFAISLGFFKVVGMITTSKNHTEKWDQSNRVFSCKEKSQYTFTIPSLENRKIPSCFKQ